MTVISKMIVSLVSAARSSEAFQPQRFNAQQLDLQQKQQEQLEFKKKWMRQQQERLEFYAGKKKEDDEATKAFLTQDKANVEKQKKEDDEATKAFLTNDKANVEKQKAALAIYQRPDTAPRANQNDKNMAKDVPCPACTFLNDSTSKKCSVCESNLTAGTGKCVLPCDGGKAEITGECGHEYCTVCLLGAMNVRFQCPMCRESSPWRVRKVTATAPSAGEQLFKGIKARLEAMEAISPASKLQKDVDDLKQLITLHSEEFPSVASGLKGELTTLEEQQEERRQIKAELQHMKQQWFVPN